MEQFHDGHFVWLRSRHRKGTYLRADDDGWGVSLRRGRASLKASWAVHLYNGHLLLHSAAYGRYLSATTTPAPVGHRGFRVELRNYDDPELDAIRWEALDMASVVNDVLLRDVNRRYLRANGKYLRWNNGVTVDVFDNASTMMHWSVEPIPARHGVLGLPAPTRASLRENLEAFVRTVPEWRPIRFVLASDDGVYTEERWGWTTFTFRGRSVYELRDELATTYVQSSDLIMCVRAGRYGRLTPLVVDLPRNLPGDGYGHTIEIVVIRVGTPAANELRHPDFDAQ